MNWGWKKNCVLNFFIFGHSGFENHNFGQGGYLKNPIKNGQKWKNKKIKTQFFSIICSNFVLKFRNATIRTKWEDRFLIFFQKKLFGVKFCLKLNIKGPHNLENQSTNLYNASKWPYLWVIYYSKLKGALFMCKKVNF